MPDLTGKPRAVKHGPALASLFFKAHGLEKIDALLTALLCGGATGLVVAKLGDGGTKATLWGVLLGLLIAIVAYVAIGPESMVTACLVSARKCFLDNQVTRTQCRQMRKQCLRKSLLY
jgi:hypothetical protein